MWASYACTKSEPRRTDTDAGVTHSRDSATETGLGVTQPRQRVEGAKKQGQPCGIDPGPVRMSRMRAEQLRVSHAFSGSAGEKRTGGDTMEPVMIFAPSGKASTVTSTTMGDGDAAVSRCAAPGTGDGVRDRGGVSRAAASADAGGKDSRRTRRSSAVDAAELGEMAATELPATAARASTMDCASGALPVCTSGATDCAGDSRSVIFDDNLWLGGVGGDFL